MKHVRGTVKRKYRSSTNLRILQISGSTLQCRSKTHMEIKTCYGYCFSHNLFSSSSSNFPDIFLAFPSMAFSCSTPLPNQSVKGRERKELGLLLLLLLCWLPGTDTFMICYPFKCNLSVCPLLCSSSYIISLTLCL